MTIAAYVAISGLALNLFALLGIYSKLSVMTYQHRLMWADFRERKAIREDHEKA